MMGNLGLPPGVAGGRRAKKGKGESKGKVRSRVTRTRDEAGFSARLDPVFLAQYCWFLVFGSIEALLEQPVAFWTRESSVVATMAVFKVSSLSMSSVRNHVVSCLETCVPSQARPKSEVPQPAPQATGPTPASKVHSSTNRQDKWKLFPPPKPFCNDDNDMDGLPLGTTPTVQTHILQAPQPPAQG